MIYKFWEFMIRAGIILLRFSGLVFIAIGIGFGFQGCGSRKVDNKAFKQHENGYQYRLLGFTDEVESGKAEKVSSHLRNVEFIQVAMQCKTSSDSLFWSTANKNELGVNFFAVTDLKRLGTLGQVLTDFKVGDSIAFKVDPTAFFTSFFKKPLPYFLQHKMGKDVEKNMLVELRIDRYLSAAQVNTLLDSCRALALKGNCREDSVIQSYVKARHLNGQFLPNGIFYEVVQPGVGEVVDTGKVLEVVYTGKFLNGQVFDRSPVNPGFELKLGTEFQLISGLQEGIKMMKKGEKANFIIPSRSAFGTAGSTTGIIGPNVSVYYEVELKNTYKK